MPHTTYRHGQYGTDEPRQNGTVEPRQFGRGVAYPAQCAVVGVPRRSIGYAGLPTVYSQAPLPTVYSPDPLLPAARNLTFSGLGQPFSGVGQSVTQCRTACYPRAQTPALQSLRKVTFLEKGDILEKTVTFLRN